MASLPFAGVADLAAWVGQDIAPADTRATAVLTAASILVSSEVGSTVAAAWDTVPADVGVVVVQVAARVWNNPQGLLAETIDDYSRRWEDGAESGVYLTHNERDVLSVYRVKPKGLWTLGTTRGDDYVDQYLAVVNQPEAPIPFLPPGA